MITYRGKAFLPRYFCPGRKSLDNAAFLDGYVRSVRDENGFDITSPQSIGLDKPIVYTKENGGKTLAVGFEYNEGRTVVNMEFRVIENQ